MLNLIWVMIITAIVGIIGGGIGYIIYIKTRPKKMYWTAKVYQLGAGVREVDKDKDGNIISKIKLKDLRPYAIDTLERVEKNHGVTIYRLQKLNMTTNQVTADMVEVWGNKQKEVSVLISGSTATVLTKGYDKDFGDIIFRPEPRENIELVKSEMSIKKERNEKAKGLLEKVMPFIITGIWVFGLVAMLYLAGEAYIKVSENMNNGMKYIADKQVEAAKITDEALKESINMIKNIEAQEKLKNQEKEQQEIESIE